MGEINDMVQLYVEKEALPSFTEKVSRELRENIKEVIRPGNKGYRTGHLHDTIFSTYELSNDYSVIGAYYVPDYGLWVNEGHHSWKGIHFMEKGLEKTISMYK